MATEAITRPSASTQAVERRLRGERFDATSVVIEGALLLSLIISLGVLLILLADIVIRALPVLTERPFDFLTSTLSARPENAGIAQGIIGSVMLIVVVIVLAIPFGVGAAIYLEEYASDNVLARFIRTNVRNLAGVPSIVFGLLGLAVFVTLLGLGNVLLSGALTLAVLVLPIIVITTSEALRAVPITIREAAFGVGATRWETVRSHVVPYAAPGILTGTILALARAFGETAPLVMVGAIVGTFSFMGSPIEQIMSEFTALPTVVYNWSREPQDEFRALTAAAIVVLLVVILLVNGIAIWLRNRFERRW